MACVYLLPVIALIRFRTQRAVLIRIILKTALYGWCAVAVLLAVGSRFEKHPSFTWQEFLLGATKFAIFLSPLCGLMIWLVNGMTRAGYTVGAGRSVTYNPKLDRSRPDTED
jgi:hypothetical protein